MTAQIIQLFPRPVEPLFDWPPFEPTQPHEVIEMFRPVPSIVYEIQPGIFARIVRALMPRRAPRRLADMSRLERGMARSILDASSFRTLSGRD